MMIPLLSRNARSRLLFLLKRKHRERLGQFLLEGTRLIADALECEGALEFGLVQSDRIEDHAELIAALHRADVHIYQCPPEEFREFSQTIHSQGIIAVGERVVLDIDEAFAWPQPTGVTCAFHELSDPGNLGTILRTSDWFGVRLALLSAGSVDATNAKAVRASMGSVFRVMTSTFASLAQLCDLAQKHRHTVVLADSHEGESLYTFQRPKHMVLLFGSEAHGLPQEARGCIDSAVRIPQASRAESLNVSIAHAIILSHLLRPA